MAVMVDVATSTTAAPTATADEAREVPRTRVVPLVSGASAGDDADFAAERTGVAGSDAASCSGAGAAASQPMRERSL